MKHIVGITTVLLATWAVEVCTIAEAAPVDRVMVVQPVGARTVVRKPLMGWTMPDATWNARGFHAAAADALQTGAEWPRRLPAAHFDGDRFGTAWFVTASDRLGESGTIVYDLGGLYTLSGAAIWNYGAKRATRSLELWASDKVEPPSADISAAGGWTRIGLSVNDLSVWSGDAILADEITFADATPARWVAITRLVPYATGGDAGIEEIRFQATSPHAAAATSSTELVPGMPFQSGCVLQRDARIPVWGFAKPGDSVRVMIAGQEAATRVNEVGRWLVHVGPLAAGGPHELTVRTSTETITLQDVLVGDVWLCGGQSNMHYPLGKPAAADPGFRLLQMPISGASKPWRTATGSWLAATPETTASMTAVGYHFVQEIRRIQRMQDVPVGLIQATWPGSPAESWLSDRALRSHVEFAALADRAEVARSAFPGILSAYHRRLPKLREAFAATVRAHDAAGATAGTNDNALWPPSLESPPVDPLATAQPTHAFNGMIGPLVPYAVRGVIWYQGESNALAGRSWQYRLLLPALITDWRSQFGSDPLPFLIVQIPPVGSRVGGTDASRWADLRESQRVAAEQTPDCGLAVMTDHGARDLHPRNKAAVGERLALLARGVAYGEQIECSGPVWTGMEVKGSRIQLSFAHASGLAAGEIIDDDGRRIATAEKLVGFAVAGKDQVFHDAAALIVGESVVVSSDDVPRPVAARYGWADSPTANLKNGSGLWASPFRTDSWRLPTQPDQDGQPAD